MNEKLLEDIGLTKGEVKVYLTLLKIGETTTGKIVEDAGISSGKIYEILEKLIKKGLVGFSVKEKTKYFSAASPNRILDYLHEKEIEIQRKEEELLKEIPKLMKMESEKKNYETNLFKGFKGIHSAIYESLEKLDKRDEVLAVGIRSGKNEKYNLMWEGWHNERVKRKVKCRAIFSDSESEYYKNFKKMKITEVKVLEGATPSAIDILKERVLIFTYEDEPACLMIKNKEIAETFRTFFENLWSVARN